MLFIRNYDRKSLDRSTISSLDRLKQRTKNIDVEYNILLKAITGILSTIAYIGELLGLVKVNLVNVVNETKNIIEENGLIGADNALAQIDKYINTGDKAIESAKTELEVIKQEIEEDQPQVCSYESNPDDTCGEGSKSDQEYCNDTSIETSCGEIPGIETGTDNEDCTYCQVSTSLQDEDGNVISSGLCNVCEQGDCNVDRTCDEETNTQVPIDGCNYTNITNLSCGQTTNIDQNCDEITCTQNCTQAPDNCPFTCGHSSECHQLDIPADCIYTCIDGGSCNYDEDCNECNYGTICGQTEACNQIECDQYDCGESCGETCHMSNSGGGSSGGSSSCSQNSCGEGCGQNTTPDDGVDYAPVNSGGGGNVICTKIISELIPDEKWAYEASVYNIKMALRNGLNKKALREYKNGLGLEILTKLPKEEYQKLFNHKLIHVWLLMKSDPKEGTRLYSKVVYDLAVKYDIDLSKYPECIKWFEHYGFISNKV